MLTGNEANKKEIIQGREEYSAIENLDTYINFKDFRTDSNYGFKNKDGINIIPKPSRIVTSEEYGISSFDFVINLYSQLVERYNQLVLLGTISSNSEINSYLRNPYKSYEDLEIAHSAYVGNSKAIFFNQQAANQPISEKIVDAFDLFEQYVKVLPLISKQRIQTRMKFVNSNKVGMSVTGLSIELTSKDLRNDQLKFEFMQDQNFPILRKLAEQYGFYIDVNEPWKLVANLSHPAVLTQVSRILSNEYVESGLTIEKASQMVNDIGISSSVVLKKYFDLLPTVDYSKQKKFVLGAFSELYEVHPSISSALFCRRTKKTKTSIKQRVFLTDSEFNSNEEKLLRIYLQLLNVESGNKFNAVELDKKFLELRRKNVVDNDERLLYLIRLFTK